MRRQTRETDVYVEVSTGPGSTEVATGDSVFDHMLRTLYFHARFSGTVRATWDLRHHLWEDVGITMGQELRRFRENCARFHSTIVPMDESLVLCSVDVSRAFLSFDMDVREAEGFDPMLVREFMWALCRELGLTLHIVGMRVGNTHHAVEASFKALGMCLGSALRPSDRTESTKGSL
ncbi:imidazoleglycerol-phosphate dehydratase [Thermogymnomonas acidicola]|uniref:Imidazoleglycerol-phosphate dehydratase n=1 Tax=Thermogymnomonas acidicola TaxID=399579 RepID=A0AA37F9S3_9ARCH|nr:imidazoleglycerol-phosphate dehydratase [Thermogymnomonas acidicola]GGM75887.1 imidazoleglycerol-phosphate dehydratase [Thermogymnomonas acidicola]